MKDSIDLGSIILSNGHPGKVWLVMPDGEGMEVDKKEIEDLLHKYYRDNF